MTQIAAEALGVPLSNVFISETATNTVANTSSTAASASSDLNGYAIWNACQILNERLKPYKEKLGEGATMKDIAHAAYFDRCNLSAQGFYSTPDIGYIWGANTGQMFFYFTQGVAAAEVEIDTLTGDFTVRRADIKMDVGRSINPAIDYGQIEGAFVQGQGLFTTEEMLWHRASGGIFTKGPGNYKIPGFRDIPQVFNVSLLKDVEWENLRTIQRSRGVGKFRCSPCLFYASHLLIIVQVNLLYSWVAASSSPSEMRSRLQEQSLERDLCCICRVRRRRRGSGSVARIRSSRGRGSSRKRERRASS
jgi:xanthine dehydrogenase/oxidase